MSFGTVLNDAPFAGDIRDLYRESLGQVHRDDEKGLRIRLCIDPPAVSALPWELAYDRTRNTFLATSSETPLTRYISVQEPIADLRTAPPISVLVAIPSGSGLDVAMERATIEDALSDLDPHVTVSVLDGDVTRSRISRALIDGRHHVFHFIGHGEFKDDDGFLVLNGDGAQDLITARAFAGFFRDYPSMKLVVLNSCQGAGLSSMRPLAGIAPQLVRAGIPAVVAMQYLFADRAAVLFAREFYGPLCAGVNRGRVDTAIAHARNRLDMDFESTAAFATPVLYMRSATGVIFDLETPATGGRVLGRADLHTLKAVRKTHETNLRVLEESGRVDVADIKKAGERMAAIDRSIRHYYVGVGAFVAATWLLLFASWIGLFNAVKLDDWLERQFVGYMDAFVSVPFDRRVALILASEDPARNGTLGPLGPDWRCHHAALLSGLTAAGAAVVAFDLHFDDASACDGRFAEAIRAAKTAGTGVVLGSLEPQIEEGVARPIMAPELAGAVGDGWGTLLADRVARRVRLAYPISRDVPGFIDAAELGVVPSFALRSLMHVESQNARVALSAAFDRDDDAIKLRAPEGHLVRSIPVVDREMNMIVGLASREELRAHDYHVVHGNAAEPTHLARFRGAIVVVGFATEDDRLHGQSGRPRYGVEQQASAISNLLLRVEISPLGPLGQYAVILLMGAAGAAIAVRYRPRAAPSRARRFGWAPRLPAALLIVVAVYALVAFLVYKQYRLIFDIGYHVASLLFVYWIVGRVLDGRSPASPRAVPPRAIPSRA
jgi:CHASE2 domain-containing sensor protein